MDENYYTINLIKGGDSMKKQDFQKIFWNSWETDEFYSKFPLPYKSDVARSKNFHTLFVKMDPKKFIVDKKIKI